MENKKTVEYLNGRAWYRAVKVAYLFFVIACYLYAIGVSIAIFFIDGGKVLDNYVLDLLMKVVAIPLFFFLAWVMSKIPQWIFYYIVLGTIKPEK